MIKITNNDRIFVLTMLPLAIVAVYCWIFAFPAHKRLSAMNARINVLGDVSTLESARIMYAAKLTKSEKRLAEIEAMSASAPESDMVASASEDDATRLRTFCDLIRECGGRLSACSMTTGSSSGDVMSREMLRRIGVANPSVWTVAIEAPYHAMTKLLEELDARKIPAIPETISMSRALDDGKPNFWAIRVFL